MTTEIVEAAPRPTDPFALIALALDKGLDPEKLYDLAERWQTSQAVAEFNADMQVCQAETTVVVKDRYNPGSKSNYPALETIQRITKPVYTRNGFSLSFSTVDSPLAHHIRMVAILRHKRGHVETHQVDIPLDGAGPQGGRSAMNAPQATGSTISYGKRYLTAMIFNITIADEDDDGQGKNSVITEEQAKEMKELLEQHKAEVSAVKFLAVYNVTKITEFPAKRFEEGMAQLRSMLVRKAKENGGTGS